MEPGSALFTLGCEIFPAIGCLKFIFTAAYHGAGENKCNTKDLGALRTSIAVFAQRDNYRQDQTEVLSTPIGIARKLPEDILKLAEYCKRLPRSNAGTNN